MLAVAVERQHGLGALREGGRESGPERRALALVRRLANHARSGGLGGGGGVVR